MVSVMNAIFRKTTLSPWFICLYVLIGLLASSFVGAANNPAPRAIVDRTVVTEGDSLTLTIRIDDTGSYDDPDYSPLQKDFEVYGNSQSSQHAITNGRVESWTQWQTTLLPKHSGQLQIPALAVAGAHTQPITIQVNPQSQSSAVDGSEPVFIEVKTDRSEIYIQQQLLLTARVYIAVQLSNLQLTKPAFDNARVEQLSETTFNRNINGTPYEVHELTYAIFPQQSGDLTIPELVFNAVEIVGSRSPFGFPGRGRALRKMSQQFSVRVKPIPKNFSGTTWLPARNLTLTESWSGDPHHLAVGSSITRTIAIDADGLTAEQLPKLGEPQLDAAKLYVDQSKLENKNDATGLRGKRLESSVLMPTRAGRLQLPEIRVVWWDIESDSEKVATLPSEALTVAAGSNTASTPPPAPQTVPQATGPGVAEPAPVTPASRNTLLWWQIAATALALLWLVTLFAYLRLRHTPRARAALDTAEDANDASEKDAWRDFSAACHANDPAVARQKLLHWAALFYRDTPVHSIEQLQRAGGNEQLTRELQLLDNRLFGSLHDSADWNGENLLRVLQEIRKGKPRNNPLDGTALPPLYPAT